MAGLAGMVSGPFAELLRDPRDLGRTYAAIQLAVAASFNEDARRKHILVTTQSEIKRRSEICIKWFRILRADIGWSTDKCLDFLAFALRNELDGIKWEPPKTTAWAPDVIQAKSTPTPEGGG